MSTSFRIGIDVGGTKIEGAAVNALGSVIFRRRVVTPAHDYRATVNAIIALINTIILMSVYRAFTAVRRGEQLIEKDLHDLLDGRGLFARMLRSLFAIITRNRK